MGQNHKTAVLWIEVKCGEGLEQENAEITENGKRVIENNLISLD